MLFLGIYGLFMLRDDQTLSCSPHKDFMNMLFKTMILASVLIFIEDTYMIMFVDDYQGTIYINNRNYCEDIFRIWLSLKTIRLCVEYLINTYTKTAKSSAYAVYPQTAMAVDTFYETSQTKDLNQAPDTKQIKDDKFDNFCSNHQFTSRECEIFKFLILGKSNQEIAEDLFISVGTVKAHSHNIFSKTDVSRKSQLLKSTSVIQKTHRWGKPKRS
jgi:DNA-binding CsgD family transcriptional regulator